MVKVIRIGDYKLIETKRQIKILSLDNCDVYAWINTPEFGEILVTSHRPHKTDCVLATDKYRLYTVVKEPKLTDVLHLELHAGNGTWQGYLLPTGLPTDQKKRSRIIPTDQVITKATA